MIALWWAKPLAFLLAVAALVSGFTAFVIHERKVGAVTAEAKLKEGYAEGVAKATAEADAKFKKSQAKVETSHAQDLKRADAQIADGLAARSELERLRARLADPMRRTLATDGSTRPGVDGGAVERELLGACAERYESVARDAGRLAGQVIGLQGYVRAACPGAEEMGGNPPAVERTPAVAASVDSAGQALVTQAATAPANLTPGEPAPPP